MSRALEALVVKEMTKFESYERTGQAPCLESREISNQDERGLQDCIARTETIGEPILLATAYVEPLSLAGHRS